GDVRRGAAADQAVAHHRVAARSRGGLRRSLVRRARVHLRAAAAPVRSRPHRTRRHDRDVGSGVGRTRTRSSRRGAARLVSRERRAAGVDPVGPASVSVRVPHDGAVAGTGTRRDHGVHAAAGRRRHRTDDDGHAPVAGTGGGLRAPREGRPGAQQPARHPPARSMDGHLHRAARRRHHVACVVPRRSGRRGPAGARRRDGAPYSGRRRLAAASRVAAAGDRRLDGVRVLGARPPARRDCAGPRVTLTYVTVTHGNVAMENPFVYGEVIPASAFVDREDELDRLTNDLLAGQKVFLISPRRYGKSSLVRQALSAAVRRRAVAVDVTVSSYSSYVGFLEGYARALLVAEARPDSLRRWIRDLLGPLRPELRIDPGSRPSISFPTVRTARDASRLAEAIFALPARIAELRRKRLVVALDEFQAINGFDGHDVEHALRAAIQHQRQVGYVFSGSEPSLMERMLARSRPFYKAGPVMRLQKIPADRFASFVNERFTRTGFKPDAGLGAAI